MEILELIERSVQLLKESQYTSSRIYTYKWLWSKGIIPFMESNNIKDYTEDVGKRFMLTCHDGSELTFHHRDLVKSADVLTNVLLHNHIGGRMKILSPYPLEGEIGFAAIQYLDYKKDLKFKERTLKTIRKRLSNFVEFLDGQNIFSLREITEAIVLDYISMREYRQIEYVTVLRGFFKYLFKKGLTSNDWSCIIKTLGKKFKHVRLPSFYSPEEIKMLETSILRSSNVGKRNYAMVMLCSRLGLRVSDVANLEFENIDWENNTLSLIQYKTGTLLSLPLLPEVGNAIIDYLQYGRKKSDSNKIFLSLRPPYKGMTPEAVHSAIALEFSRSGIDINGRHHGAHSLRFSLAQRMLDKSIPIPIISETLGHQNIDMTSTYTRIDITHLRQCVLEVPPIPDDFYMQKGGCFYE